MTLAASNPPAPQVIAPGTATAQLIDLWTHGKSKNTAALYRRVAQLLTSRYSGSLFKIVKVSLILYTERSYLLPPVAPIYLL